MTRHETVLEQLRRYRPADALESTHHQSMVNLLTSAPTPFSRAHFEPGHFTASLFIVDPHSGRLLLHHHRRLDRWLQMGGHVEGDEHPHAAALREGREESGLGDLELFGGIFDVDVHAIPAAKDEPDHHHFDIRYLARTLMPDHVAIDRNESNDIAWVPLRSAIPMMNEDASTRAVRKIERLLDNRSIW
jgi:8-oxo-dGTP pyrophosphatase MutT (NUDIX family)